MFEQNNAFCSIVLKCRGSIRSVWGPSVASANTEGWGSSSILNTIKLTEIHPLKRATQNMRARRVHDAKAPEYRLTIVALAVVHRALPQFQQSHAGGAVRLDQVPKGSKITGNIGGCAASRDSSARCNTFVPAKRSLEALSVKLKENITAKHSVAANGNTNRIACFYMG